MRPGGRGLSRDDPRPGGPGLPRRQRRARRPACDAGATARGRGRPGRLRGTGTRRRANPARGRRRRAVRGAGRGLQRRREAHLGAVPGEAARRGQAPRDLPQAALGPVDGPALPHDHPGRDPGRAGPDPGLARQHRRRRGDQCGVGVRLLVAAGERGRHALPDRCGRDPRRRVEAGAGCPGGLFPLSGPGVAGAVRFRGRGPRPGGAGHTRCCCRPAAPGGQRGGRAAAGDTRTSAQGNLVVLLRRPGGGSSRSRPRGWAAAAPSPA